MAAHIGAAAFMGDIPRVNHLLSNGSNVEDQGDNGWTPLIAASFRGHVELARYLVEQARANVNGRDSKFEQTPLHFACWTGKLGVARFLVQAGANVEAKDKRGMTPLLSACCHGRSFELVRYLAEQAGANVEAKNISGMTPLHDACLRGFLRIVRYLLEQAGASVNAPSNDGKTALHFACIGSHTNVARYLIEQAGANANVQDSNGDTPLHFAAKKGMFADEQFLVETEQTTASIQKSIFTITRYLVENGADVDTPNKRGQTPLHSAITMEEEIEEEENVDDSDEDSFEDMDEDVFGVGLLNLESDESLFIMPVVRCLVENGRANINARDTSGMTLLHCAGEKGRLKVVKLLLQAAGSAASAMVRGVDNKGNTPLDVAAQRRHFDVVRMLVGRMNVKVTTAQPKTAASSTTAPDEPPTKRARIEPGLGESSKETPESPQGAEATLKEAGATTAASSSPKSLLP